MVCIGSKYWGVYYSGGSRIFKRGVPVSPAAGAYGGREGSPAAGTAGMGEY